MYHLVERRSDEATQSDDVCVFFPCRLENFFCRNHYAEIDDVVVIASKNYSDDIFSNVMNVAFYSCEYNLACLALRLTLLTFENRGEIGNSFFHDTRTLYNLW